MMIQFIFVICYYVLISLIKIQQSPQINKIIQPTQQNIGMQFESTWNSTFDKLVQGMCTSNDKMFQTQFNNDNKQIYRGLGFCRQQSRVSQTDQLIRSFDNYVCVSQLINWPNLKNRPNTVIKKYRESVYYGEFLQGKRTGLGIMLYTNGRIFQGQWIDNFKHGKAYQKFQNGAVYSGTYSNGKPEGYGVYSWENGQTYEGEWLDGMKNGSGIWRGPTGDSYIGQWKDGLANGYGVHTWVNGDRYEGQFKDCLKHGEGIQKFANGDSYKGAYQMGKPQGYGEYYWAMGSYFKGNFVNGLREGKGIWKRGPGNTDKYEGEYKQDKKQGHGIFTWENGNVYEGTFSNDLKHGYGEMHFVDGRVYRGEWENNQPVQPFQQFAQENHNRHPQTQRYYNCNHQKDRLSNRSSKIKSRSKLRQQNFQQDPNQCDFFQIKSGFYQQPFHPDLAQHQKKFRARDIGSKRSVRNVPNSQKSSRSCMNGDHCQQQNKFVRKYSVGSRCTTNKKIKQGNSETKMMSSTFFLYKIHGKTPALEQSYAQIKPRQVKTSGGMRKKHISEQIKYFTRNKINPEQF